MFSNGATMVRGFTPDTIPPEELSKDEPESATGSTEARRGSNETATSTRHEIPSKFTLITVNICNYVLERFALHETS